MTADRPTRIAPEIHLDSIDSTNRELARLVGLGRAAPGTALLARSQTAGRGSRGRRWWSRPGDCLTVSVALGPCEPPVAATLLGAVAVRACAERLGTVRPRIKWPNDVLLDGSKLAGVLAESLRFPGGDAGVILGIGLNVRIEADHVPEELRGQVAALARPGRPVEVEEAWTILRSELEDRLDRIRGGGFATLSEEFVDGLQLKGQEVELRVAGRTERGRLAGLDASARVHLELPGGGRVDFAAAHVESLVGRTTGTRGGG